MTEQFKPGETVQLKSGGPLMTIQTITDDIADCDWFDNKNEPHTKAFPLHSLCHSDVPPVGLPV